MNPNRGVTAKESSPKDGDVSGAESKQAGTETRWDRISRQAKNNRFVVGFLVVGVVVTSLSSLLRDTSDIVDTLAASDSGRKITSAHILFTNEQRRLAEVIRSCSVEEELHLDSGDLITAMQGYVELLKQDTNEFADTSVQRQVLRSTMSIISREIQQRESLFNADAIEATDQHIGELCIYCLQMNDCLSLLTTSEVDLLSGTLEMAHEPLNDDAER